jgi:isopenicillin N synthase-like dioxygenase
MADDREKMTSRMPLDTGYRPFGIEYSQSAAHPDEVESFSVSRRVKNCGPALISGSARVLHDTMHCLFDLIEPLAARMTDQIASEYIKRSEAAKLRGALQHWSLLQLNYSRPSATEAEYINELHEDGCLMTIMTVSGPGLELQASDGSFTPIRPTEDLLLLSGEILWLLSGGKVPAIYHRVRTIPSCSQRMSLLFFADIDPSLCQPWIENENNKGIDIGDRVLTNAARYGLTEWKED